MKLFEAGKWVFFWEWASQGHSPLEFKKKWWMLRENFSAKRHLLALIGLPWMIALKNDDWATISWEMMSEPPFHKKWWRSHHFMRNDDWATISLKILVTGLCYIFLISSDHSNLQHIALCHRFYGAWAVDFKGWKSTFFSLCLKTNLFFGKMSVVKKVVFFFLFSAALRCKSKNECWRERRMEKNV